METELRIAISKGRVAEEAMGIMEKCGYGFNQRDSWKRSLQVWSTDGRIRLIFSKSGDVPTLVEKGVADIGIVGNDVVEEAGALLYEIMSLPIGICRLCVAGPKDRRSSGRKLRVATKYPVLTRKLLAERGIEIEVIPLSGSVELGPIIGLSDVIVDIVETGRTLADNGLEVYEELMPINTRVVCNRTIFKTRHDRIVEFVETIMNGGTTCV